MKIHAVYKLTIYVNIHIAFISASTDHYDQQTNLKLRYQRKAKLKCVCYNNLHQKLEFKRITACI